MTGVLHEKEAYSSSDVNLLESMDIQLEGF